MKKKDKPEQNQDIPDALGKDELKNEEMRRSALPNRHDISLGDGELAEPGADPDNSRKETDSPPNNGITES